MAEQVLITGGAKRLGKSMALYFASQGYNLLIHVNKSIDKGREFVTELSKKYPKQSFNMFCFDLVDWRRVDQVIAEYYAQFGLPDVIIHNASQYLQTNLAEVNNQQIEEMMAIHLYSPMIINREYKNRGGHGQIITILDSAITTNVTTHGMYLLAKKALHDYTKMCALEWAPHIRINALALGPVLPPEHANREHFNDVVARSPLKIRVTEKAINASLSYLINNENITGQTLFCDSGQHLQ